MKKTYMMSAAAVLIAFVAAGCDDTFDELEVSPNQISMNSFFSTPEDVNQALMTCYGYIQTQRNFGAMATHWVVFRSDEAASRSDYAMPGMYGADLNSSHYVIEQPYTMLYSVAGQATYIIDNIDAVHFDDAELKRAYRGEAFFWRAFAHYFLLTNWRQVAPITSVGNRSDYVRASAAPDQVWDIILSDLEQAKANLPKKGYWTEDRRGRVTAGAAAALRGKAYLMRSGIEPRYGANQATFYTEAAREFAEVINGTYGQYRLVEYAHNFDVAHENNDESVFEIQFLGDAENNGFNPGTATSGLALDSRGFMLPGAGPAYEGVVHDWLYDAFATSIDKDGNTDLRMFSTIFFNHATDPRIELGGRPEPTGPGGYKFTEIYPSGSFNCTVDGTTVNPLTHPYKAAFLKHLDLSLPMRGDSPTNWGGTGGGVREMIYNQPRAHGVNFRYIRYADVLLMYAEAVLNGGAQGGGLTAAAAFNLVRDRANMAQIPNPTMEDIKKERMLELALEGHRFYDLLRWGDLAPTFRQREASDPNFKKVISATYYLGFKEGVNEWLPIPITEIESNPYISQNNGY